MSAFGSAMFVLCFQLRSLQYDPRSESMVSPALLGIVRNIVCTPLHSSSQLVTAQHKRFTVSPFHVVSVDLLAVLVVVGRFLIANGKALEEKEPRENSTQRMQICRRHLICTSKASKASKSSKGSRL